MTSDVCHPESYAGQLETVMDGIAAPNVLPINIARDRPDWRDLLQLVQNVGHSHVSGMKNHVAVTEHLRKFWMEPTVGIGEDAYEQFFIGT
ncbi:MAG: hypothetical protein ACI80V_002315 [Rhodothermales bacterium]|jgi:hypothetical protein